MRKIIATAILIIALTATAQAVKVDDESLMHICVGQSIATSMKMAGYDDNQIRAVVALLGWGKETTDGIRGGYFDVMDFVWGCVGAETGLRMTPILLEIRKSRMSVGGSQSW